ncbi:MAG: hypothetical protein IPG99_22310 [Ignavibacteria bacterium]|nr:hypothetical protein [Ignavibacteria bacterium]
MPPTNFREGFRAEGDLLTQNISPKNFQNTNSSRPGQWLVQPFEMYTCSALRNNTLSMNVNGNEANYEVEKDFMPYGFSGSEMFQVTLYL